MNKQNEGRRIDEMTLHIYASDEGGYKFDIYEGSPEEVAGDERESLDGGHCTGTQANAIDMASAQAQALISRQDSNEGLTKIQLKAIKEPCPNCGGKLREVEGTDEDSETGENYLWCNGCLLSMDGDGGYTK